MTDRDTGPGPGPSARRRRRRGGRSLLFAGLLLALVGWTAMLLGSLDTRSPLAVSLAYLILPAGIVTAYLVIDSRILAETDR